VSVNYKFSDNKVKEQLERIFASDGFVRSHQMCKFLRFVVEASLSPDSGYVKGYTIATEVFGRDETFDPQKDPIVRIEAGRLRRKLEHYYSTTGLNDPIRIEIPKGAYLAVFQQQKISETFTEHPTTGTKADRLQAMEGQAKPVIAVLPFIDLGNDETEPCLLEGIADELSSGLAKFQDLRVIDYYSASQFRGRQVDIREIGKDLGADFLITGSMKTILGEMKVRVSLSETKKGLQKWTHVYENSLSGNHLAEIVTKTIKSVLGAVAGDFGIIFREWKKSVGHRSPSSLTHYEAVFLYRHAQLTGNIAVLPRVKKTMELALEEDPEYAMGWAILGEIYLDMYASEYTGTSEFLDQGLSCAKKSIGLDPMFQYAHYVLAYAHGLQHDPHNVIKSSEQILKLNPYSAYLVGLAGFWLCIAGDFERGLLTLNNSIKLNPHYPTYFHHSPFLNHLKRGEYPKAFEEAEKFHIPDFYWSHLDKTVAAALLGRSGYARDRLDKVLVLHPDFAKHPRYYVSAYVIEENLIELMLEGLKKAGLNI